MATNKHKGEVELNINGKKYLVVYDWNAIAKMQSEYSNEIIAGLLSNLRPDILANVLCFGLEKHHPDVKVEDIMAASPPLFEIAKVIDEALALAYFGPEGRQADKGDKKSPKAKPGK